MCKEGLIYGIYGECATGYRTDGTGSPDEDIMTALSENILENEEAAPNETEGKKKKSIVKVEKEIHFTDIKEVKDIVVF